jgi:MFS family permease
MSSPARGLPKTPAFWFLAVLLGMFLFAASAPSPLYALYAKRLHFSSTTVTAIYAVYAAGALGALLLTGRLSDHLGRRPIVFLALLIQIAGMIAFIRANGIGALYLGRVLQGTATGIASGAISAWLLDLEPPERPRLGSLLAGIALLAGLGSGGLISSLLVQYGPDPLRLVFWILIGVYAVGLVGIMISPDVVEHHPGWLPSMRPHVSVPQAARAQFFATTPSLVAIWSLGGLYLSLGPALAVLLVKSTDRVFGGLVIAALMGGGAIASAFVQKVKPRALLTNGSTIVVAGVGLTLLGVLVDAAIVLYAGSLLAGLGFGPAFSGAVRSLGPLAPPEERGALFAAIYIVVYVAISVPTIAAGLGSTKYGLKHTAYVYGLVVMVLAATTAVAVSRRARSEAVA